MDKDQTDVDVSVGELQLADNDMLVDEYEQYKDGKPDVVLVSPPDSLEEQEAEPLADDCMECPEPFDMYTWKLLRRCSQDPAGGSFVFQRLT